MHLVIRNIWEHIGLIGVVGTHLISQSSWVCFRLIAVVGNTFG